MNCRTEAKMYIFKWSIRAGFNFQQSIVEIDLGAEKHMFYGTSFLTLQACFNSADVFLNVT